MKIRPVITEKSMSEAKKGNYSFYVDFGLTKLQIKKIIADMFGVTVAKVRTVNFMARVKRNYMGCKITISAKKKAIVSVIGDKKIDLFEIDKPKKAKKVKKEKKVNEKA